MRRNPYSFTNRETKSRFARHRTGFMIGGAILALVIGLFALVMYYHYGTATTRTLEISHVERVQDGNSSKYLVYTENHGVHQNTDTIFYWKFRSSDVYNDLVDAKTAECKVYGWRIGILSQYPNIVDCEVKERYERR